MKTNRTLKHLELQAVGLMDGTSFFEGLSGIFACVFTFFYSRAYALGLCGGFD